MRHSVGILAVPVFVALAGAEAAAFSGGIEGRTQLGCGGVGCHGTSAGATVTIDPILAGDGYDVTVTVDAAVPTDGVNQGGFNLRSPSGTFSSLEGDSIQNFGVAEVGHTASGNDQRSWSVHWAPSGTTFCSIDLFAAANAVNGNEFPDPSDLWGLASHTITFDTAGDAADPDGELLQPAENLIYVNGQVLPIDSPMPAVVGDLKVVAAAGDDVGVSKVELFDSEAGGEATLLGEMTYVPSTDKFEYAWETSSEGVGPHTLTVRVTDCADNVFSLSRELIVIP